MKKYWVGLFNENFYVSEYFGSLMDKIPLNFPRDVHDVGLKQIKANNENDALNGIGKWMDNEWNYGTLSFFNKG